MNNQPMGFYHPAVLVEDAKRHGVEVLPVDVNISRDRCLPEVSGDGTGGEAMRLGLNYVRQLGAGGVERVRWEREKGAFRDLQDFCDRVCTPNPPALMEAEPAVRAGNVGTSLNPPIPAPVRQEGVENLVAVGGFDWLGIPRRQLLWRVKDAYEAAGRQRLVLPAAEELPLPEMTELERTSTDYQVLEVTTGRHLISYYRERLMAAGVVDSRALRAAPHDSRVKVAGLVITRQAPGTARRFRFFTLEDEWGHVNLILRPDFFSRHRRVANQNQLLMFEGVVQNVDNVVSVMATDVWALPPLEVAPASHDYR
jgi:error-prone DNA polymerase